MPLLIPIKDEQINVDPAVNGIVWKARLVPHGYFSAILSSHLSAINWHKEIDEAIIRRELEK